MNTVYGVGSKYLFSTYEATLNNAAEIDSGWLDFQTYDKVQFEGSASDVGMTMVITSSNVDGGGEADVQTTTPIDSVFHLFNVICRQRYIRFQWQNNTGSAVSDACMSLKAFVGSSDKLSVFPVNVDPSAFSQAALVQSIARGLSPGGVYQTVGVNEAGALLSSSFGTEVARKVYAGYRVKTKFGRNPDIGIGSTEDMWNGGSTYTGFNATGNEELAVVSDDVNDTGSLVSSGTATGGSETTLEDSGATFISDGVAVGDILLNDTKVEYGLITSVDSETQVTVFRMIDGVTIVTPNESGDTYRIATATSTGAAVLEITEILDEDFIEQDNVFVILDGTSTVTTSGVSAMRASEAFVILSGSSEKNEGEITINQAVTTANVFAIMSTFGRTSVGCWTVPAGKIAIVKRMNIAIVRASGAAGSGTVSFNCRDGKGGSWQALRIYPVQTGAILEYTAEGGAVFVEGTDVKFTIEEVSDNATIAEAAFEYYLIDQ